MCSMPSLSGFYSIMTNDVMISGALSGCFTIVVWGSTETELTAVRVNPYKREAKNGNAPRLTLPK